MSQYLSILCVLCHSVIECVPGLAPTSESIEGLRGEICEKCCEQCNVVREEMGLEVVSIPIGAYREVSIS